MDPVHIFDRKQKRMTLHRFEIVLGKNYLAPDIQIELLYLPATPTGRYPISETAVRKIANRLSWADQRREWAVLKQQHHLGV